MEQKMCPVDVISMCSASGDIRPLRFRMEDEAHQLLRIDIEEIISIKEVQYVIAPTARQELCDKRPQALCKRATARRAALSESQTGFCYFLFENNRIDNAARRCLLNKTKPFY